MARRERWKAFNTSTNSTNTYTLVREDDDTIVSYTWPAGTGDPTASGDLTDHRRILIEPIELGVNASDNGSDVGRQKRLDFQDGNGTQVTVTDSGTEIDVTYDLLSGAKGQIIYHDGVSWVTLAQGSTGQILEVDGGGDPSWAALSFTSGDITDFNEAAQDAVGGSLADTSTIDFTYDDAGNQITADVIQSGISTSNLNNDAGFISGVEVEDNGTPVGTRNTLNFIGGTDISLTIADDSVNDEIDVTIDATHQTHTHSHSMQYVHVTNDATQTISAGNSSVIDFDSEVAQFGSVNLSATGTIEFPEKGDYVVSAQVTLYISDGSGAPAHILMYPRLNGVKMSGASLQHEWGDRVDGQSVGWYQSVAMSGIVVQAGANDTLDLVVEELDGDADVTTVSEHAYLVVTPLFTEDTTP